MTKSRKAKGKNKDFQKVKLKVGKKLPKGQNETIAAFKSSSIQIKEQLKKKDGSQPLTRKKLNIKELLVQCSHYNTSVRTEAVQGILELLKSSSTVLDNNLSAILERSSALILDKEYNVRQKAIDVLRHVCSVLSQSQIAPFFGLISAHITCAMTHLAEAIQQDSLAAVDILLDAYPQLMNASAERLLPCFVKQIASPGGKSGEQYTLVTNPSSKKSSQTWRLKVLHRLQRVLHSVIMEKTGGDAAHVKTESVAVDWEAKSSVQLLSTSMFTADSFAKVTMSHAKQGTGTEEQSKMKVFIAEITPLLSQCWVESRPSNFTAGSSLGLECLNLVDCILAIYQLFRTYMDNSSLFEKEILQYFLPYFPYTLQRRKADNKSKQSLVSPDVINLRLCHLLSQTDKRPVWLSSVVAYLSRALAANNSQQKTLLHKVITTLLAKWPQDSQALLDHSFHCFTNCRSTEDLRSWIQFFSDIAFSSSMELSGKQDVIMKQWMLSLPALLLQVEHESKQLITLILSAINQAAIRGVAGIQDKLRESMSELLEKHFWSRERKVSTSHLVNLLVWCPQLQAQDVAKLKIILLNNRELCSRFLEHLLWRSKEKYGSLLTEPMYISFLFALLECEREQCRFAAAMSASGSETVQQVGRNLKALQKDHSQLADLHTEFHRLL